MVRATSLFFLRAGRSTDDRRTFEPTPGIRNRRCLTKPAPPGAAGLGGPESLVGVSSSTRRGVRKPRPFRTRRFLHAHAVQRRESARRPAGKRSTSIRHLSSTDRRSPGASRANTAVHDLETRDLPRRSPGARLQRRPGELPTRTPRRRTVFSRSANATPRRIEAREPVWVSRSCRFPAAAFHQTPKMQPKLFCKELIHDFHIFVN